MEEIDKINSENYLSAQKRVKELKGFYIHALVYIIVNSFITISKVIRNLYHGESFEQSFFEFETFIVWIFWGIGLIVHAINVFGFNFLFRKGWQERKIAQFMNEDEKTKNN